MQQGSRPESLESPGQLVQRKESRSGSFTASTLVHPPQLTPEPVYIAASAASQIVNSEYVSRGPNWLDEEGADDGAGLTVAPASLVLINAFLDQLLFNFLKGARSTAIVALKPAIHEVLKPRLAKDAIQGADDELKGYLTGGDDEELNDFHGGQEFKGDRNLQRIFRRTRLRCMVYTRLGDMEEEDEDMYLEGEHVEDASDERHHVSRDIGSVSPAAAIFLTSIIEFIGEQALMIAGEAAYNRLGLKKPSVEDRRPAVEEGDIEKLAFNTTLGRLWRSWRSKSRPSSVLSRRPSSIDFQGRKSSMSAGDMISRTTSGNEVNESSYFARTGAPIMEHTHDDRDPASIPLPQPRGLPEEPDFGSDTETAPKQRKPGRPRSLTDHLSSQTASLRPEATDTDGHVLPVRPERPRHRRSSSLPIVQTAYQSPVSERFVTPSESLDPFNEEDAQPAAPQEAMPSLTNPSETVPGLEKGNPAVSTMYDGLLGSGSADTHSSTRGVSMLSEYSSTGATDGYDQENDMTPQALNFDKELALPAESSSLEPEAKSRASTMSTEYEFGAGETPTGIFGPGYKRKAGTAAAAVAPGLASSREEQPTTGASKHVTGLATIHGGDRLRTYDESGQAVKREIPVLYEAPSNQDVIYNPKAPTQNLRDDATVSSSSYSPQLDGPPQLTPLQELRDAAHDTSDESSSNEPSNEDSRFDESQFNESTRDAPRLTQPRTMHETYVDHDLPTTHANEVNDQRSLPQSAIKGVERAAVQRVSSSTNGYDQNTTYGRTSTSSNKDGRPLTAGSVTSKLHRTLSKESGAHTRQALPRRSSSESREIPSNGVRKMSQSNKVKDFESLIRSDETIQYTLTPQNMRAMEDPNTPRWSERPDVLTNGATHRTTSAEQSPVDRSPKSLKGTNGLRANPTNGQNVMDFGSPPKVSPPAFIRGASGGTVPKSPNGPQSSGVRDPLSRDASTRDFADFIRSTGPDTVNGNVPRSIHTSADQHSRNVSSGSQQSNAAGKPLPQKLTKQNPVSVPMRAVENKPPVRASSKLKARDPIASPTNTTADLADFLRSGPPGSMDGSHQAPRTQPSNHQTNGMSNGRTIGSHSSVASTQDGYAPSKMTQSSANSRTGLLESRERPGIKNNGQRSSQNDDIGDGPKRKQRRVRDPYALDSEDEDEYVPPPVTKVDHPEESLSDFLRNYTPPPDATNSRVTPTINTNAPTSTSEKQRKASGTTIRERLARNIAVVPDTRPLPPKAPKKEKESVASPQINDRRQPAQRTSPNQASPSQKQRTQSQPQLQQSRSRQNIKTGSPSGTGALPQLPPLNPRATSPHLTSQPGSKMDAYKHTHPTYAAHVDRSRPKPQARDELGSSGGGGSGGMGDLADFLRETEPPAPSGPIGANARNGAGRSMSTSTSMGTGTGQKEGGSGGGFGRMFGRKRKV